MSEPLNCYSPSGGFQPNTNACDWTLYHNAKLTSSVVCNEVCVSDGVNFVFRTYGLVISYIINDKDSDTSFVQEIIF